MEIWTTKIPDSHIILYAKHHYQETNLIEDLKKIYSIRNAVDIEYLNTREILANLLDLVEKLIKIPELEIRFTLSNFISDIDPNSFENRFYIEAEKKEYNFEEACIKKCLSLIRLMRVYKDDIQLIPLDEPNENILPLVKK